MNVVPGVRHRHQMPLRQRVREPLGRLSLQDVGVRSALQQHRHIEHPRILEGTTLRENLGLPRPAGRYVDARAAASPHSS